MCSSTEELAEAGCEEADDIVELNDDDKSLIQKLVIKEHFASKDVSNERSGYRCKHDCDICNDKGAYNSDDVLNTSFMEDENDFSFTREKREKIIKTMVHEFFESKWKESHVMDKEKDLSEKLKAESEPLTRHCLLYELRATLRNVMAKERSKIEMTKMEVEVNTSACNVGGTSRRIKSIESCTRIQGRVDRVKMYHGKAEQYRKIKKEKMKRKMKLYCERKIVLPMDDKEGLFYIDKTACNVTLYEKGLREEEWNPTQCVYEMCAQCGWGEPQYALLDYIQNEGFRFCLRVKGHLFTSLKRGRTKKQAKHEASAQFLRYLGFKLSTGGCKHDSSNTQECDMQADIHSPNRLIEYLSLHR